MYRFRAAEIVVATGVIEQPLVFGRNDLPGVMLGSAARRLVNQFRIVPGERAVVVTADDLGIDAACDLAEARHGGGRRRRPPRARRGRAPGDVRRSST